MTTRTAQRADYGVDAPYAPILMALGGAALLALSATRLWAGDGRPVASAAPALAGVWLLLNAATFLHTTRRGKFAAWAELLDSLQLRGDERLLDVGCGRGAVLLAAAKRLPHGRAVGVDVWSATDQSGNAAQVTSRNAVLEGVADRIELHTADMCQLPFEDGSFDVIVSSLAIHNVRGAGERAKAVREAARVLKRGGR
jgi:arsenite methyltransferase